ncbi:sentrin-specific protease 6 isoform X1 [Gadus macrocephalus]|uniref:sentrin-specific protease 6 isoform X1 n=2 Tax=Gadus macrocephalus TaxID=80720 RepID=UPI0028CB52AF|nr:sentrin-specific protease 6 isoform X1 [Gadus macrocephalus]
MAHNRSCLFEALDRSESQRDGGFKHSWGFSLSADEETRHDTPGVTMEERDRLQHSAPEGKKTPPFRQFSSADHSRTYENRASQHSRVLNKLGPVKRPGDIPHMVPVPPAGPNRARSFIPSPSAPQGMVLQGRYFQHAHNVAAVKPAPRNNFSTQPTVELDQIILTCPDTQDNGLNIKRRVQQKRKSLLDECCSFPSAEPLRPGASPARCIKCHSTAQDAACCSHCGHPRTPLPSCQHAPQAPPPSAAPRPPIHPHHAGGPHSLSAKNFYGPVRAPAGPVLPLRVSHGARGGALLAPLNGRPAGPPPLPPPGTSGCCGLRLSPKGKKSASARQHELNDPIVLSSDDEEEDADNASTGSVNRLDSVSPRPADSAHSSPAPSGGRVEAAVKSPGELDELAADMFDDVNMNIVLPRRPRKDPVLQSSPGASESFSSRPKKPKLVPNKCASIILQCRSVRVGTLRRMVTKPVVFSIDQIQLETDVAAEMEALEVNLQASELISCEWCSVRKLPVLFFQTTPGECLRLRSQLDMSSEKGGQWYDSAGDQSDEKYIVLIFENGLTMNEQMILEDILGEIGRANGLSDFPAKLSFDEANVRLVNYNKATKEKEEKSKPAQGSPGGTAGSVTRVAPVRTRMATRQQAGAFYNEEDEDMAELQPTFSGPIVKLMVYPPPPAKGGISVTNEDLHCLNDGEFLNDVILDFYLKYLVLERLKKEDSQRSHVFSSFFYKRLNQRERRNAPEASNLPIQKRKHNRVKTWTRHVDLFQKDFIFVPINESAHWYLAVICFPGLQGPQFTPNPLYKAPPTNHSHSTDPAPGPAPRPSEEGVPDHCRPITSDDLSDSPPRPLSHSFHDNPTWASPPDGASTNQRAAFTNGVLQPPLLGQEAEPEPHYNSELQRISVCYGPANAKDDVFSFSDANSSCPVESDEGTDDGTSQEEGTTSDGAGLAHKFTVCKQPCILIMDSLRGPARSTVVKTLREYLEVEWEVRKGTPRSFGKEVMKGSSPRVPQQDNYSDCGVYVLQYVESFFQNPVLSFHLPVSLDDWFPQQRMKTKREEIRELILRIQSQQDLERRDLNPEPPEPPGSPEEEPEVEETSGPVLLLQHHPPPPEAPPPPPPPPPATQLHFVTVR